MADEVIAVSADWAKRAYVDGPKYKAMYEASTRDPATFWAEHGKRVDWIKPFSPGAVRDVDYTGDVRTAPGLKGLIQSTRLPCSAQKVAGSLTEASYIDLYLGPST